MGGGGGVRHVTLRALFLQLKGQTGRGGGVFCTIFKHCKPFVQQP